MYSEFEVDAIVILLVRIINIPVPPLPIRGGHFIQKFALGFVTEDKFSQALSSGRELFPQFLLVSSLASDPKATVQPHEPVSYRFYSLSLPLL